MEIARQLEDKCNLLESTKITARKQACTDLIELLDHKPMIDYLSKSESDKWNRILASIQTCMLKDGEKKFEEFKRKGSGASNTAPLSADAFKSFIRVAIKANAQLNYRKLLNFITESLRDQAKRCYHNSFLKIVSESFLTNPNIRSILQSRDWETLYLILKHLCEEKSGQSEQFECLALVIKWGPLYNFPINVYREEFNFITKLCQKVSLFLPTIQRAVLEILYDFFKHTAKDNRMACCKLGEEVFIVLMELYKGNANDDKMKTNLIEIFLLQFAIHHPNGVKKGHPAAYAVSWNNWQRCLDGIYAMLNNEIEVISKSYVSKAFLVIKDGVKQLVDTFVLLFVEVCQQLFDNGEEESDQRSHKRARLEININSFIDNVKESKSWT